MAKLAVTTHVLENVIIFNSKQGQRKGHLLTIHNELT